MGRTKQNKRNPFGKGLTKKDREERALAAKEAAAASVGAQGGGGTTRPRPSSATVTPITARAKKRTCRAGVSPRVPTESQNIAGVDNGLSSGDTRIRSTPRRLFDGPITVQGDSPSSRRHSGAAARSRKRFGDLGPQQKHNTFEKAVKLLGNDVLGFFYYMCRRATTVRKVESMQEGVSKPAHFRERVADIVSNVMPKTKLYACSAPEALALKADCFMSDGSYQMLRVHQPDLFPPLSHLKTESSNTQPALAPLLDKNAQVVGYYCSNIWRDLIVPEMNAFIQKCKKDNTPLPTVIRYKAGGDGHTISRFNKDSMPHEQICLSLLLPGRKHNSIRNVIPLANALDEKENYNLLEIMNKAVDPQLPRGEREIMGHKFFFEDLRMGDRSYLSFENGHSGVHAVFACLFCFLRFGLYGLCCKAPELEGHEALLRTNEHYGRMALITHQFHEFEARCTEVQGPEPENSEGPGALRLTQKGFPEVAEHELSPVQREFKALVELPCVQAQLQASGRGGFRFATNQIKAGLAEIRQACFSIYANRLTETPIERTIVDVLHWIINIVKGLVEFCDEASCQVAHKTLEHLRDKVCGSKSVASGYDGRQCMKLLEGFEEWVSGLKDHVEYPHIVRLMELWRKCYKILMMQDFGDNKEEVIAEFEECTKQIETLTDLHFEGKPVRRNNRKEFVGYGCTCLKPNHIQIPGYFHAYHEGVRVSTRRPMLRRVHGHYEHATLRHMAAQMRAFGPLIHLSSWVIEALNKIWKRIYATQVTWCDRDKLGVDSEHHPAKQAMRRMHELLCASRRKLSKFEQRTRDPYSCGCCGAEKEEGHVGRNPICKAYFDRQG
jgi:hypothetical protein